MNMPTEEELIKEECLELFKKIVKSIHADTWSVIRNPSPSYQGLRFFRRTSSLEINLYVCTDIDKEVHGWVHVYKLSPARLIFSSSRVMRGLKPETAILMLECFLRGLKYDR